MPNSSCHPFEHKQSGIKCLLNRLHTYPITRESKQKEENTIKTHHKNRYSTNLITKQMPHKQNIQEDPNHQKAKLAIFTNFEKEVRQITKLKKAVFWDVAPCRYCVNLLFGGTYRLHLQGRRENKKIRNRRTSECRH
jgi:hypothetical protein